MALHPTFIANARFYRIPALCYSFGRYLGAEGGANSQ